MAGAPPASPPEDPPVAPVAGMKVVVTGATGQVGGPVAVALAEHNEVVAGARFTDRPARVRLEAAGVRCVRIDLLAGDVGGLPADAEVVLNFAVAKSNRWGVDLDANAGGLGWLMEHHRAARAFVHCSSTAVYRPSGHRALAEDAPLGDSHAVWPFLATYSISKIAAEAMARFGARRYGLPTTIARLSVPYGDSGGWPALHLEMVLAGSPIPVHTNAPSVYHPIHERDIVAMVPGLVAAADVPATVVNWGGSEPVSIEEWCGVFGELVGTEPAFAPTDRTLDSVAIDVTKMTELLGPTTVGWRDGMRQMTLARHPELF